MNLLIEAFSGIAGDMTVAALLDLGVDRERWEAELRKLHLDEPWELSVTREQRHGIEGNRIQFLLHGRPVDAPSSPPSPHAAQPHGEGADHGHAHPHEHSHDHHHHQHDHPDHHDGGHSHTHGDVEHSHGHGRTYGDIRRLISESGLSARAQERAQAIFLRIGEAEAKLHGIALDEVHFHEVGALDAILDICGVAVALDLLGVDRIYCQPLPVGTGTVHAAHGHLPLPAPATAEILRGFPLRRVNLDFELVTPTGAGIVAALAEATLPPQYRVAHIGYGVGTKDDPRLANVLRIFAVESVTPANVEVDTVAVLETTLDDSTPEWVAFLADRLREAGALDVTTATVQMKKGRTGFQLTILARPADADSLMDLCFQESTTIGVRHRLEQRRILPREAATVDTPWGAVKVKVVTLPDGSTRSTPEYDSCVEVATRAGIPLVDVYRAAGNRNS